MREWTEVVSDWVTSDFVEVRFRTDGTRTWVWAPSGDGLGDDDPHAWALVKPQNLARDTSAHTDPV